MSVVSDDDNEGDSDDCFEDASEELLESEPLVNSAIYIVPTLNADQFSEWLRTQGLSFEECNYIKGEHTNIAKKYNVKYINFI